MAQEQTQPAMVEKGQVKMNYVDLKEWVSLEQGTMSDAYQSLNTHTFSLNGISEDVS